MESRTCKPYIWVSHSDFQNAAASKNVRRGAEMSEELLMKNEPELKDWRNSQFIQMAKDPKI